MIFNEKATSATPGIHASTHAVGGSDPVTPGAIGAEPAIPTKLSAFNSDFGTAAGTVCAGDDVRLTGPRVPTAHASSHASGGSDQVTPVAIGAAEAAHGHVIGDVTNLAGSLSACEQAANKGQPGGYAPLNAAGFIAPAYLPGTTDPLEVVANAAALPVTGEVDRIYVTTDTTPNKAWRWTGFGYVEIAGSPGTTDSVPEGAVNQYFTSVRAAAAQVNPDWNATTGKGQILNKPALGTAAARDVPASGDAQAVQVVLGDDTRLSDSRAPTAHSHPISEVTDLAAALAAVEDVSSRPSLVRSSAGALREATGFGPSLFVDMLEASKRPNGVPDGFTFSRPCKRTHSAPDGLIHEVANGVLRHEWDPATGRYKGALFEGDGMNYLRSSAGLVGASWTPSASGSGSVVADTGLSPDGVIPGVMLTDADAAGDTWYYEQAFSVPDSISPYTASVYLKPGTAAQTMVCLYFHPGSLPAPLTYSAVVDWATMNCSAGADLTQVGGGWWRLSFTADTDVAGNTSAIFRIYPATNAVGVVGSVFAWGAQVENGARATSFKYRGEEDLAVARLLGGNDFDSAPWNTSGTFLFQENAVASPDGGMNGWRLQDADPIGDQSSVRQSFLVTANTAQCTFSISLKRGSFYGNVLEFRLNSGANLHPSSGKYVTVTINWDALTATTASNMTVDAFSFTDEGDGWRRISCTVTNNNYAYGGFFIYPCLGHATQEGTVYAYNAQCVQGDAGVQPQTPSPDRLHISAAGLHHPSRGTLLVEVSPGHGPADMLNLRSDADNRITVRGDSVGKNAGGTDSALPVDPASTVYALAWDGQEIACVTDLTPLQTATWPGVPVVDKFVLGSDGQSPNFTADGGVLMAAYFPARLPDETLAALVET